MAIASPQLPTNAADPCVVNIKNVDPLVEKYPKASIPLFLTHAPFKVFDVAQLKLAGRLTLNCVGSPLATEANTLRDKNNVFPKSLYLASTTVAAPNDPVLVLTVGVYAVHAAPVVSVRTVNAPVFGVVAPTVPLCAPFVLMLAVPVRFVTVPLDGVPRAPPLTTNAPAVPVLTPSAVTTPVPVVMVDGATPAPPPCTSEPAARAADVAQVDALEK